MEIKEIKKVFASKWLNLYEASFSKDGKFGKWFFASRDGNKAIDSKDKNAAVVIVPRIINRDGSYSYVLIREFRIPLLDYEWSFPAGLVDEGESIENAAIRELKEETGLIVNKILEISPPIYSSGGLTDESVQIVFVECEGIPTNSNNEDSESIEIHIMNLNEIENILKSDIKIGAKAWSLFYGIIREERLISAIRKHKNQTGNNLCWENDMELWKTIDKNIEYPHGTLPEQCEFLEKCKIYYESRLKERKN